MDLILVFPNYTDIVILEPTVKYIHDQYWFRYFKRFVYHTAIYKLQDSLIIKTSIRNGNPISINNTVLINTLTKESIIKVDNHTLMDIRTLLLIN